MSDDIHSCSYYCQRPGCIKAQRDALRDAGHGEMVHALELIALGPRPDGAYNRDRRACQQLAMVTLGKDKA